MNDRLFQILSANWLIHRDAMLSLLPQVIAMINGQQITVTIEEERKPQVFCTIGDKYPSLVDQYELSDLEIPENSVAVIPVQDVLYSWRTMQLINWIRMAKANPRISSILFLVNSPGGMVTQIDIAANEIKSCEKPTIVAVFDMVASAAFWLVSAADYRIATSPIDQAGSIGTKTTILDWNGYFEQNGIKIWDLYATKSTKKENAIRQLTEKENPGPIVETLDFVNEYFHKTIRENLGLKEDSEVFEGDIFFAEKAKTLGLINEINTLDYALRYAHEKGLAYTIKKFNF